MDEQRIQAYLDLIQALLSCPSGKEPEILQSHPDLIDKELVRVMEFVAAKMVEEEEPNAKWLQGLAAHLAEAIHSWNTLKDKAVELYRRGQYAEAVTYAEQALDVARKLWGDSHPSVATSLNNLAFLYESQGRLGEAEPLYHEALQTRKHLLGAEHPDVAISLNNLAFLYESQGRLGEAEPLYYEALQMSKRLLGEEHPSVASSLNNLAGLYKSQGRLGEAEPLYYEALQMSKRLLGEEHPSVASSLNNLALLYKSQGRLGEAETLYHEALQMMKRLLGAEHPHVATSLNNLALLYESQGRLGEAETLYHEALQMMKRLLGAEHPHVATSLNNLALLYESQGRLGEAEPLYHEALQMRKRLLGSEHPDVASSLNNLAGLYESQGRFSEAEPLYHEALQMIKRLLGAEHPDVASSLNNLALLYKSQGRLGEAEPLYHEALQMNKRLLGAEHPHVATSLNNLALLYESQGRFSEAEPLYHEALQMRKRLLGAEHPHVATSLHNLAGLYKSQGRLGEAEPLYHEALQMNKRLLGAEHPSVATSLNNLALLYNSQGRFSEAEPLYHEALQMNKRLLGAEHPSVASSLNNLALLYESQGRFSEAEPLYHEALQMRKRLLGAEHPDVASSLHNLAGLYKSQGRLGEAEPLYHEALQMNKRLLGAEHPDVATSLNNLAILLVLTGRLAEALARMTEATQLEDSILRRTFGFSSEKDRLTYLQSIRNNFEGFLSLVLNYLQDSPEAVQTALDLVLRRKALAASALAAQNQALYSGRYRHLTAEFKQLRRLSEEILHLTFAIPEADELANIRETLQQKQTSYDNLQRQLAQQVPEIQLQDQPRDRRAVALELPEGSRLVEFVCTRIFDFTAPHGKKWQPARYLAFILPAQQPDAVQLIDLGEAEHIDRLIRVFREAASRQSDAPLSVLLSDRKESPAANRGNRLDLFGSEYPILAYNLPAEAIQLREALFDKITPYLNNSKHLILAPDGALNILPFQLLPLEGERKLMDEYNISYLSVGRDILRAKISAPRPASPPVVIADPDFDLKPSGGVEPRETQQPVNNVNVGFRSSTQPTSLAGTSFHRAPGTRFLGESVAKMLGIKPYLDREALLSHLTTANCPSILLIATHGYFSHGKGQQDYVNLVKAMVTCSNEQELIILLIRNRRLLDKDLVLVMKQAAAIYENKGNKNVANWWRNGAAKITEIAAALAAQPRDNRLSTEIENPMLRSGLALAGANTWISGGLLPKEAGKGFLFAQEVAGLDLWANELTVLSACQTGIGDIQLGEGVFGLRRAFAVAGTKTLIMSLWSVPDRVTALLMERMFADLKKGKGRGSALQSAQNYIRRITVGELRQSELGIEVLKELMGVVELKSDAELPWDDEVRLLEHPFYWGAWICQGETKPMVTGE